MINKKIVFCILFVFSAIFIFAEDDDYSSLFGDIGDSSSSETQSSSESTVADYGFSAIPDFKLSLWGDHEAQFRMPVLPDHFTFDSSIKAPKFRNKLGVEVNYKSLKFVSSGRFDVILNNSDNWENILHIMPLENFISWSPWKIKFSAGLQTFSWGVADGMNPTDNINPRDFRYGTAFEKIPILSAAFSMYPVDFFSFDVVYVPFEQNNLFPVDFNDYIPDMLFSDIKISGTLTDIKMKCTPTGKELVFGKLNFDPSTFKIGGKTNFHFAKVDFSFSYLYDYDRYYTPDITFRDANIEVNVGLGPMNVPFVAVDDLTLIRKRVHRFGADIKGAVDRFGIWAEVCFNMTEDYIMDNYQIRNHSLDFTTGFDFNYGPDDSFYANFQCIGTVNFNYDDTFYKDYPFYDSFVNGGKMNVTEIMSYASQFNDKKYMKEFYYRAMVNRLGIVNQWAQLGLAFQMSWPVLDNLLKPSLTASYLVPIGYDTDYEHRYGCLFVKPELDIMPLDSFHILIGAELFFSWRKYMSDPDTIVFYDLDEFGMFHKDSSVYVAVKYKWNMDWTK